MVYARPVPPQPVSSWAINTIAILGVFYSLYLASELLLPLVLASLLALLFAPVVLWLQHRHVPRPLGAGIVVLGLLGLLTLGVWLLAQPAADWANKAPTLAAQIEDRLIPLTSRVQEVSKAAERVQSMTGTSAGDSSGAEAATTGPSLLDRILEQTLALAAATAVVFLLLFFLLSTADRLRNNTQRVLPDLRAQRRVLVVTRRMQREISRYLLAVTVINIGLGACVVLVAWLFGMPNPVLWGALAGLLNYVPYLGPIATLGVISAVSLVSLPMPQAALMPAAFAVLTSLEGQLVTPTVLGRHLSLNPVFVLAGLIFWGWLWGALGALLAVPIMASVKIVCDYSPPLRPIGVVLGR